ncbi:uncharacterized protein LOC129609140 [Condylostylus longicornis]|uniref:uncharacterized protein LOC129609140 n=1 Tax=Condylostylus longicornis TaxID=2530218 RepID=UPI00244E53F8|nr:uncharacterized protein LOC129609140 [Condylostylus longicornis]
MEKKFIELVKQNRFLYDRQEKNYGNVTLKQQKWKEIADELEYPVERIKQRWFSLRDCYRKERRKMSRDDGYKSSWKHFHYMNFLDDIPKRNINDWSFKSKDEERISDFETFCINEDDTTCLDNKEKDYCSETKPQYHKNESCDGENDFYEVYLEEVPKRTKNITEVKPVKSIKSNSDKRDCNSEDGDKLFSQMVASSLSSLSRLNSIKAKTEIFCILEKYVEN